MQEERKRKKEDDDLKKKAARAQKMAEFEKWKNPPKANFVISKKAPGEEGAEVCYSIRRRFLLLNSAVVKVSHASSTS